jgi:branched-subunit amino acid aminotransferase/4-amino-4-deoxychorismate lyase
VTSVRTFCDAAQQRGFHLGDGLFETVLVAAGRACLLDEHLARMARSCGALGVPAPGDLAATVAAALPSMWADEGRPALAALRISVSRGAWTGLEPRSGADDGPGVVLLLRAIDAPAATVDAWIVDAPRIDPASPLAGHKVLSWMDKVEARRLARAKGAGVALLRTIDGDVAEADAANLFVVVGRRVVTPPVSRGVLPGITRARVLAALRARGGEVEERRIDAEEVLDAGEAFLTSSLAGVQSLQRIDGRAQADQGVASALRSEVRPDGGASERAAGV